MPKFAANLSMLFTEYDFLDRFAAAASAGFTGVEYLFPYAYKPEELKAILESNGLTQVLFNLPPGDWDAGDRGLAALPGREDEFKASVATAIRYAEVLGCPRLHAMAGLIPESSDKDACLETYISNLRYAAKELQRVDKVLLIEPINPRDMPGFFLNHQEVAREIVERVDEPNLKIQFDVYHCQIVQGDITRSLEAQFPHIGHIQIAGVPDRNEPNIGEVNYPWLFDRFDELGYEGWVGCEYRPRDKTLDGLLWGRRWGLGPVAQSS